MNSLPRALAVVVLAFVAGPAVAATTFHVVPGKGSMSGNGSASRPWSTLSEVVSRGRIRDVRPGDTILLGTGDHGDVRLSGDNAEPIVVAAAPGATPRLSRFEIDQGSRWTVRGLTVSPLSGAPYGGSIVTIGERGPSSELVLEDCWVYTALDVSGWTVEDWMKANSGITMGRHGTRLAVRNNYVQNVRFGINLCAPDSICEGNVVTDFSADGIRVTRDGLVVQWNVVKNAYVSDADGDKNHDDGIQCFLFNVGTGTVRNVTIRGNLILNREDDRQRFPNALQGIGFFDGPLVDFVVESNVVQVSHWHGISLYDAQGCTIRNNVVQTRWLDVRLRPWILLGQKQKAARGNVVTGNFAHSYDFKADAEVRAEDNRPVTDAVFEKRIRELEAKISADFGRYHPVSGLSRVGARKKPR